jgi:hypothetical protein
MSTSPLSVDVYVSPMRPYNSPDPLGEGELPLGAADADGPRTSRPPAPPVVGRSHLGEHGLHLPPGQVAQPDTPQMRDEVIVDVLGVVPLTGLVAGHQQHGLPLRFEHNRIRDVVPGTFSGRTNERVRPAR